MSMSKYYTYSITDLTELHKRLHPNTSIYTLKTFISSLTRIEKVYNDKLENLKLNYLDDINKLIDDLKNKKYSSNSILSTISSLSKLCKMIDASVIIQNNFKKKIKELKTKQESENNNNIPENRQNQFIEFKTIQAKIKEVYKSYILEEQTLPSYRKFLILSLFTLQVPTRIQNYLNMIVIKSDDKINLDDFKDKQDNYLLIENKSNYTFIFNKYKTSNKYGCSVMKVNNPRLIVVLNRWFEMFNTKNRRFLINEEGREITQKLFTKDLKTITSNLFNNDGFSVDVLRSSFITELYNTNPSFRTKCNISELMGHSSTTAEINYRKVINDVNRDDMGLPMFEN